jgi:hypothetical protein
VQRTSFAWCVLLVVALVGVLIAAVSTGRPVRRILLLLAGTVVLVVMSLVAYRELQYFVNPLVSLVSLVVACELAVRAKAIRDARLT